MATFTWTPDFGASGAYKLRVRTTSFGDGYEQRVGDGINNKPVSWTLRFSMRADAETNEILAFLEARAGVQAFDWTPPQSGSAIRVVCREWGRSQTGTISILYPRNSRKYLNLKTGVNYG